jgi:hypothetical protein
MRHGLPHPNLVSLGTIEGRQFCYALSRATGEHDLAHAIKSLPQRVLQEIQGSITTKPWCNGVYSEAILCEERQGITKPISSGVAPIARHTGQMPWHRNKDHTDLHQVARLCDASPLWCLRLTFARASPYPTHARLFHNRLYSYSRKNARIQTKVAAENTLVWQDSMTTSIMSSKLDSGTKWRLGRPPCGPAAAELAFKNRKDPIQGGLVNLYMAAAAPQATPHRREA